MPFNFVEVQDRLEERAAACTPEDFQVIPDPAPNPADIENKRPRKRKDSEKSK